MKSFTSSLGSFFSRTVPVAVSASIISIALVASIVSASTTISTDINTQGQLTVTGTSTLSGSLSVAGTSTLATSTFAGYLGIGTTTPNMKLSLWGSGTNGYFGISSTTQGDIFTVGSNGKVGIWTTSPGEALEVAGNIIGDGNALFKGNVTVGTVGLSSNGPGGLNVGTRSVNTSDSPGIVTLISGQNDGQETFTILGTGSPSVASDTVNFIVGTQGWAFTMGGAGTATFRKSFSPSLTPPVTSGVGMAVYIPSTTNLTQLELLVYNGSSIWQNHWTVASGALTTGWNYLRAGANNGNLSGSTYVGFQAINKIEIVVQSSDVWTGTIGHVWLENRPKAQIVVTADGAYSSCFVIGCSPGTSDGGIKFVGGYPDVNGGRKVRRASLV